MGNPTQGLPPGAHPILDFRAQLLGVHNGSIAKAATGLESAWSADDGVPINGTILGQSLVLGTE